MKICIKTSLAWKAALLLAVVETLAFAQSSDREAGNCLSGTSIVAGCWNPDAGKQIPESLADYPEFLPNLNGWDFRINLPHVRFQRLRAGAGSSVAMVGVIEDNTPLYKSNGLVELFIKRPRNATLVDYGHRSNSIWLFRESFDTRKIFFSQLPSRRDKQTGRVENATTLTGAWFPVGAPSPIHFFLDRIATAVVGRGLGTSTIHLVARGSGGLYHTQRVVDRTNLTDWNTPWEPLNVDSPVAPSIAATGTSGLGLAWVTMNGDVKVQQLDTTTGSWTQPVTVATHVEPFQPRLLWDGRTLDVLYTSGGILWHACRTSSAPLTFSQPAPVSSLLTVHRGEFDAMVFNEGLHVAIRTQTADFGNAVFYINSKSPLGFPLSWTIPSDTGLRSDDAPRIATLYENVFVVAVTAGRVTYARKDPNRPDNRIMGNALGDRWLSIGTEIDPGTSGDFGQLEALTFNSNLYLTAQRTGAPSITGGFIMNFGRAAMKQLFRDKWGMTLLHGEEALGFDPPVKFGGPNEIRKIGDFNGDHFPDLIRFPQVALPDIGLAPVHVSLSQRLDSLGYHNRYIGESVWRTRFSAQGSIPLVGDFNGDGKDDVISFIQPEQHNPDGSGIGDAQASLALSTGTAFGVIHVWHRSFSRLGEKLLVGDFDGDGKDDIVVLTQHEQHNPDGSLIGIAPVWVALSSGTTFGTESVWQTSFSGLGDTPLVGDFNGDGKADIATFLQRGQLNSDGTLLGHAPVWVALSDGTKFGQARPWHTFFSPAGELPLVADVNMDGKDDIVTFLRGRGEGVQANNVYVAFSTGSQFETSVTWASNQVRAGQTPFVASYSGRSLGDLTGRTEDTKRLLPDLFVFDDDTGTLHLAWSMFQLPYAVGAPWERYRFFTEKGIGAAEFPEFIYNGPNHCLAQPFRFILNGVGGVGAPDFMISSVKPGGRAGHIYEEMTHSLFANCMRENLDPFHLFNSIYKTPMPEGLDALKMPGCGGFDDCRDPEHFFLQLLREYRIFGDTFRNSIFEGADFEQRRRRLAQYEWIKNHWYKGAEFKQGEQDGVSLFQEGVLCLPGECRPPALHP